MRRSPIRSVIPVLAVLVVLVLAGATLGGAEEETQVFLVVTAGILVTSIWFIPAAARKEPTVSVALLATAFVVKLLGTLARFLVLQYAYEGGDALEYHKAGLAGYESVRALDFSFLEPPGLGTSFLNNLVPFLYAVTGPSMAGGFVIFSSLAFWGTWMLYRAHRVAFPGGDSRLYFILLFFLPTMVFWPSSLGKDALILFGLGMGAYGLATVLQRVTPRGLAWLAAGVGVSMAVRPPVGAVLVFAAAVGFLIRPGRLRSPLDRPVAWVVAGPILLAGFLFTMSLAFQYESVSFSLEGVLEEFRSTSESLSERGGSTFDSGGGITTPGGAVESIFTVLFRPLPWEATNPQVALAALETTAVLVLVLSRLGPSVRALKRWRGGMIISAVILSLGVIVPLTAVPNFGVLARQRAQFLPFMIMVLTAAKTRRAERRERPRPAPARDGPPATAAPRHAPTTEARPAPAPVGPAPPPWPEAVRPFPSGPQAEPQPASTRPPAT